MYIRFRPYKVAGDTKIHVIKDKDKLRSDEVFETMVIKDFDAWTGPWVESYEHVNIGDEIEDARFYVDNPDIKTDSKAKGDHP